MNQSNDLATARRELDEALKAPTRGWRELEKIDRAQKRVNSLKKAIGRKWYKDGGLDEQFGGL